MATSSQHDRIPPLLTEGEVSAALRVSGRTVRRWADRGILDAVKVGGIRRYRASDVERLLSPSRSEAIGQAPDGFKTAVDAASHEPE